MSNHTIETKFGPVELYVADTDTIRAQSGIPHNAEVPSLTINGIEVSLQGWLSRWRDGRWHFGRPDERSNDPHVSRRRGTKSVSLALVRKAREEVEIAVGAWALTVEAREARLRAEVATRRNERNHALAAKIEAEKALREAQDACDKASRRLEAASGTLFIFTTRERALGRKPTPIQEG